MRIHVQVFDDGGQIIAEGDVVPQKTMKPKRPAKSTQSGRVAAPSANASMDFSLPERAFFKRYAGSLSGSKKFVLLVAYLAKGKSGSAVSLSDVTKHWNKMTSLLGEFNMAFTNRARESGWVDTTKTGVYVLHGLWKEAFA